MLYHQTSFRGWSLNPTIGSKTLQLWSGTVNYTALLWWNWLSGDISGFLLCARVLIISVHVYLVLGWYISRMNPWCRNTISASSNPIGLPLSVFHPGAIVNICYALLWCTDWIFPLHHSQTLFLEINWFYSAQGCESKITNKIKPYIFFCTIYLVQKKGFQSQKEYQALNTL